MFNESNCLMKTGYKLIIHHVVDNDLLLICFCGFHNIHVCSIFVFFLALTKYKKRHYHMMKNLLTGVSEVQADLVRVSFI